MREINQLGRAIRRQLADDCSKWKENKERSNWNANVRTIKTDRVLRSDDKGANGSESEPVSSEWNITHLIIEPIDGPISVKGEKQPKECAHTLKGSIRGTESERSRQ